MWWNNPIFSKPIYLFSSFDKWIVFLYYLVTLCLTYIFHYQYLGGNRAPNIFICCWFIWCADTMHYHNNMIRIFFFLSKIQIILNCIIQFWMAKKCIITIFFTLKYFNEWLMLFRFTIYLVGKGTQQFL